MKAYDWTPLHCAAANKHKTSVTLLINNGADANIANSDFQTPLHLAAMNGCADVILALLDAGVDVNVKSQNGVSFYNIQFMNFFFKYFINIIILIIFIDSYWNAIHYAASASLSSVIDPLLLAGADINCCANDGTTPLHIAAKSNLSSASNFASALIGYGAYVDSQDSTGSTPLHYAIASSNFNVAKVLLESGADPGLRNNGGQTAADTAPVSMMNQTRAFFANWEDWDEMTESIEFK